MDIPTPETADTGVGEVAVGHAVVLAALVEYHMYMSLSKYSP